MIQFCSRHWAAQQAAGKLFGKLLGMQEQDAKAFLWAAKRVGATLGRSNLVLVGLAGSGSAFHRD
jgi:hypothetical protein